MEDKTIGDILNAIKKYVTSYEHDVLPVVAAIADPKKTKIGVTIQRGYPLTLIERNHGIPFGCLRSDPGVRISDSDHLHGCKWSIEVHEAVFQVDAMNAEFIRTGKREGRVVNALTTGIGNVLQNLRSVAYADRTLSTVMGEELGNPYACLVEYSHAPTEQASRVGVELLLFDEAGGGHQVDKHRFMSDHVRHLAAGFENEIRWAVSGYPLLLDGQQVSLEMTAANVSDYRHVWRLPKLEKSLVKHLAPISAIPNAVSRIEFYFGFDDLRGDTYFIEATLGNPITLPISLPMSEEHISIMSCICDIDREKLLGLSQYDSLHRRLALDPDQVATDFIETGYQRRDSESEVQVPGDFFVDKHFITVILLPAIYPHHIVGITKSNKVINISIMGRSGKSGITIQHAKDLCSEIELTDALIFDNGFDVVSRIGGGSVICHKRNTRQRQQTRLTAALHFGYLLEPSALGGDFDGFEVACITHEVDKHLQATQRAASSPTVS
jgi:hypothetical protein